SPSPTTTSEAATAITVIANTWPSSWPTWRANAISARVAPFNMISTESRMVSGLRRTSTPIAPIVNSIAASTTYQVMSGPCIRLFQGREAGAVVVGRLDVAAAGVCSEDDPADRGDEEHDRRHLECDQVVGEEQLADGCRRAE